MEIKGKIIAVLTAKGGTSQSTGKDWRSQDYVIETIEQYPKKICFNVWGDKIETFAIKIGDMLSVSIDIDAHEYNGNWYNSIRAWKVEKIDASTDPIPTPTETDPIPTAQADDLPF